MKNLKELRLFFNLTQEELAKILSIDQQAIAQYESGRNIPLFKIFLKMVFFFQITFDYLILNNDCLYPKNLKLLKLAKKLDELLKSEARNTIESSAKSLLGEKINKKLLLKQDIINIELKNNFNSNLKNIRKFKELKQRELSSLIGISRPLLAMYEKKNYPPIERLIKFSDILNISIHALATGEKLNFDFQDRHFGKIMLLADNFLSLEHQKTLITLMEAILQTRTIKA